MCVKVVLCVQGLSQCFTQGSMRPGGQVRQKSRGINGLVDLQVRDKGQDRAFGHITQLLYTYVRAQLESSTAPYPNTIVLA
jgi:hypothetical protein